jgi:PAS domain S-box-containing protein
MVRRARRVTVAEPEERDLFRAIFDAAAIPIIVRDEAGTFVAANRACSDLFGLGMAQFREASFVDLTHPDDRERSIRFLHDLLDSDRQSDAIEKRYVRPDGSVIWARTSVSKLTDDEGSISRLVVIIEDLSARREAEAELRRSEEQVRQIAENIHDAFWLTTADYTKVLYLSPAIEAIWGLSRERLYENAGAGADRVHPDDLGNLLEQAQRARDEPYDFRMRIVHPDGSLRWVRSRAFPIRNAAGETYRIAGVLEDLTAKYETAELLERARRYAADLVRAAGEPLRILQSALGDANGGPDESASDGGPDEARQAYEQGLATLTPRERQVMELLVRGHSSREMGKILTLAPKTIEGYRARVKDKMQVKSLAELVRLSVMARDGD